MSQTVSIYENFEFYTIFALGNPIQQKSRYLRERRFQSDENRQTGR